MVGAGPGWVWRGLYSSVGHGCGPHRQNRAHTPCPLSWEPLALPWKVRTPTLMAGPSPAPAGFRLPGQGCPDWLALPLPRLMPRTPPVLSPPLDAWGRSRCPRLARGKQPRDVQVHEGTRSLSFYDSLACHVTAPLAPRALTEGAEAPNFCFPVGQPESTEASVAPGLGEGTARPNRVLYPLLLGPVSCPLHLRAQGRQEQVTQA